MKLCRWWSVQETFIQAHHLLSHLWLWRLEPNCTDRAARAELWSVQLIGPDIENSRWWIKSGIRTRRYRALWPSQKVSSGRRAYNVGIPVRAKIWAADSGLGLGLCLKGRGETVGTELKGCGHLGSQSRPGYKHGPSYSMQRRRGVLVSRSSQISHLVKTWSTVG